MHKWDNFGCGDTLWKSSRASLFVSSIFVFLFSRYFPILLSTPRSLSAYYIYILFPLCFIYAFPCNLRPFFVSNNRSYEQFSDKNLNSGHFLFFSIFSLSSFVSISYIFLAKCFIVLRGFAGLCDIYFSNIQHTFLTFLITKCTSELQIVSVFGKYCHAFDIS